MPAIRRRSNRGVTLPTNESAHLEHKPALWFRPSIRPRRRGLPLRNFTSASVRA